MENQDDENKIRLLYNNLLDSWNKKSAAGFANLFAEDGNVIGFDGSMMNGWKQISDELSRIFINHEIASYTSIVKEIRSIAMDVYILRAVAGMVPPGKAEINPEVNAIQTLVAKKEKDRFVIVLFQNTPAAFHGRKELTEELTIDLQAAYNLQMM